MLPSVSGGDEASLAIDGPEKTEIWCNHPTEYQNTRSYLFTTSHCIATEI